MESEYLEQQHNKKSILDIINELVSSKNIKNYNKIKILYSDYNLNNKPVDLIPAIKTWLGADNVKYEITLNEIQRDMETNIYQHYSTKINLNPDTMELDMLGPSNGKNALFNITNSDINISKYATRDLKKYENIINGVYIDKNNHIILTQKHNEILHIHIPVRNKILTEKYVEYRFNLLELGNKSHGYIFIKQMLSPRLATPGIKYNSIIGIEFNIDEKEFVSDEKLSLINKFVSGFKVLLES